MGDPTGAAEHLATADELYQCPTLLRSGRGDGGRLLPGINAATVAVLRGDLESARTRIAGPRHLHRGRTGYQGTPADYWRLATLGEARLILGDHAAAAHYAATGVAVRRALRRPGLDARRRARTLSKRLPHGELRLPGCCASRR